MTKFNALDSLRRTIEETVDAAISLEANGRATPEKITALKQSAAQQIVKPRLSVGETAELLGISTQTVRRYAKSGVIECERDAATGRLFFPHLAVLKYRAQAS